MSAFSRLKPRNPRNTQLSVSDAQAVRAARIRRVPGIDGIRGIAVMAVVLYHFFGDVFPGGYLGVDMFFVLSGFLITSLLIRERAATGRIDLGRFWIRRARRILPAAMSVLVIMTVCTGLVGGDPAVGLPSQFFGTMFFVNNWVQIAGSHSYFMDSGIQVFAHYWSLAVEEQFYVLFPLLFVVLARRPLRRLSATVATVCAVLAVASAGLMAWLYNPAVDPTRVYYGTDTHSFGLLLGALLAAWLTTTEPDAQDSWPKRRNPCGDPIVRTAAGLATLGVLGWLIFTLPDTDPATYRGGLVAASAATAGLIASAVSTGRTTPAAWLVRTPVLRWLGERSFSLYLWHWPVVVLLTQIFSRAKTPLTSWEIGLIALAISIPLAAWSYTVIEEPIRRGGYAGTVKRFFSTIVGSGSKSVAALGRLVVIGVLTIGAIFALATAPRETELERDLAELAAMNSSAAPTTTSADDPSAGEAANADGAAEVEAGDKGTSRSMPSGEEITAIGDSVMLASSAALQEKFPGIFVDGAVSRAMISIDPLLETYDAQGLLRKFVMLGFGTNSAIAPETIDGVMAQLGSERIALVTLPYGDRTWIPESRKTILDAANRYDNLYVVDWCHIAQADKTLLRVDEIHPSETGAVAYADAEYAALQQWVAGERTVPDECGL